MKKILTIVLSVLLCIGAIGGSFALAKHLDENPSTSVEDSSTQENNDGSNDTNNSATELVEVWELCTDESDLAVGDKIIIASKSGEYALSETQNTSNRAAVKVVKDGDLLTINDDVQVITLEQGAVDNTLALYVVSGYLYAPSSSSNHLKTKTVIEPNGSWSITIDEGAVATIVAQGDSEVNTLKYNATNKLFSCYTSSQEAIVIYKLVEREIQL